MSSPEPAPHQAASALSVKARPGCANFTSDNTAGCLPEVLAAVSAAAAGTAPAYGNDEHTRTLDGAFERVLVTGPRSPCATGGGNTDDPCAKILAFESTQPSRDWPLGADSLSAIFHECGPTAPPVQH